MISEKYGNSSIVFKLFQEQFLLGYFRTTCVAIPHPNLPHALPIPQVNSEVGTNPPFFVWR